MTKPTANSKPTVQSADSGLSSALWITCTTF